MYKQVEEKFNEIISIYKNINMPTNKIEKAYNFAFE